SKLKQSVFVCGITRQAKAYRTSADILLEPRQRPFKCINSMFGFTQTMSLPRVTNQHRFYASSLQGHVHLFRLRYVNIVIVFAMKKQCRCLHLSDVTKWRP